MKKFILLGAVLIAGIASATALSTPSIPVITKMTKAEKPVKLNGVYVVGNSKDEKDGHDKGLCVSRQICKETKENVIFALDSLVGRMENGDYTVKEAYRYDEKGNSIEACYYNWDYASESWALDKKITAEWNSGSKMTSEETLFFSFFGDTGNRMNLEYDENGMNIETDVYMFEEGEWMPSQKSFFKYDSYGNMTEELIQVPGETVGEWVNLQKNVAEWTPTGLRTLSEAYFWDGTQWIPADGRLAYEFDEEGRMVQFQNDVWVDGEWQNFLRII